MMAQLDGHKSKLTLEAIMVLHPMVFTELHGGALLIALKT